MTEVMLKVVALCFEGVVILVFDLPPRPSSPDKLLNIVICNQVIGGESVLVEDFTLGVGDDEFAPIDQQCIVP